MTEAPERWCAAIGLGANLGDRRATLASAVTALTTVGDVLRVSSLYETEPVGPPQPAYLNAAVALEVTLAPERLLDVLLEIERAHGRERREKWGPRTLDLDVLFGRSEGQSLVFRSRRLAIPHPAVFSRSFAVAPLFDVMPELRALFPLLLDQLGGAPPIVAEEGWWR